MLSMGPQLVSMIPQALQGLSSPLSGGLGVKRTGPVSVAAEPLYEFDESGHVRLGHRRGVGGNEHRRSWTCGAGRGRLGSRGRGRPGRPLGGLSVPATWTAAVRSPPVPRARSHRWPPRAGARQWQPPRPPPGVPECMGVRRWPGLQGRGTPSDGTPRYGKPVKILRRANSPLSNFVRDKICGK